MINETYKVSLPKMLSKCPPWWFTLRNNNPTYEERIEFITNNHGTIIYIDNDTVDYIEFPSEAHFHWFLLKI